MTRQPTGSATAWCQVVVVALLVASSPQAAASQDGADGTTAARVYPINPETAARPITRATRTTQPITIDAQLDEPDW
ncbi:MAG TPA: hypothetical protein VIK50_14465, partial [Gemmatimonadaceae bacterium]